MTLSDATPLTPDSEKVALGALAGAKVKPEISHLLKADATNKKTTKAAGVAAAAMAK